MSSGMKSVCILLKVSNFAYWLIKEMSIDPVGPFRCLDTIISPIVTEKSTSLSEFNKIVFKVHKGSSKSSIKKSIEKIFKVNVVKINTIKLKGKIKMVRNKKASKPGYKKAIITLKKGQSIDLATGV